MDLQQRLEETEAQFENAKAEMHRFQGEYRVIKTLIEEKAFKEQQEATEATKASSRAAKKAATIEAVPEGEEA